MSLRVKIGWAQTSITPPRPAIMEGQMYMRYAKYVHDPITATALVLDNAKTQAILVSMDMTEVPVRAIEPIGWRLEEHGIPSSKVSYHVTHSHNSSPFDDDFMRLENEQVYDPAILPKFDLPEDLFWHDEAMEFFIGKIADLIIRAWDDRKEGGISSAHDYAAIAFNRRPQFETEDTLETVMYGDCSRKDFIRFEEGTDTAVELLYTFDREHQVTGVICNVPCPSQVYELHYFLSADFWGPARDMIREKLGRNVYVLPAVGAAGDLSPIDLVWFSKTNKQALLEWGGQAGEVLRNFDMTLICQEIGERISEAVSRGLRRARNYIDDAPVFEHQVFDMKLPIRQVTEEEYQEALADVEQICKDFTPEHPMQMKDVVRRAFEPQGVILRYRQQKKDPMFSFSCHVLRIGDLAIATNPFELYHEFGMRIKARANAPQVMLIQLSNGLGGYLPTRAAVEGGSYSSKAASTVCGPEGGDALVERTLEVIDGLFA